MYSTDRPSQGISARQMPLFAEAKGVIVPAASTSRSVGAAIGDASKIVRDLTTACVFVLTSLTLSTAPVTAGLPSTAITAEEHPFGSTSGLTAANAIDVLRLSHRVTSFAGYPAGWSGPSSKPATAKAAAIAREFVTYLGDLSAVPRPRINLSADGEISFYWRTQHIVVDFGISRGGVASYYAKLASGAEFTVDRARKPVRFPPAILRALLTI
jgi:hypothetical protein